MFENLKKAWNATKAWAQGVSAYVTTLFTTEGTFEEANRAAMLEYRRVYNNIVGEESLRRLPDQVRMGDVRGVLNTVGNALSRGATRVNNQVERELDIRVGGEQRTQMAQEAERAQDVAALQAIKVERNSARENSVGARMCEKYRNTKTPKKNTKPKKNFLQKLMEGRKQNSTDQARNF